MSSIAAMHVLRPTATSAPHGRTAVVHYWLVTARGGERVLQSILELLPDADLFTHVLDRPQVASLIGDRTVRTTFVNRLPYARRHYQKYLPLMPRALEQLDMSGYDLVISSESGPAKGVIVDPTALHVCYCHSPMRYIWDQYHLYLREAGIVTRLLWPRIAARLRQWDVTSAARVDLFIANSTFVQRRISKYYNRRSIVIPPPVDTDYFAAGPETPAGDHYLLAGQMVAYKRPDLAIEAFRRSGRQLRVVGDGADLRRLCRDAPNITLLGRVSREALRDEYRACRALIFPGLEDFGIVPVEAMAAGRPVIAFGRGGVCDSVLHGSTGLLFPEQSIDSLNAAVDTFEAHPAAFDPHRIADHARSFDSSIFSRRFRAALDDAASMPRMQVSGIYQGGPVHSSGASM
ncbi:MAG: glycosyltransferase [Alphaproteobacteria bacterium]